MANEERLRDYLKLVIADLRQANQRLRDLEDKGQEPIAIVAMGCRFPGGVEGPEDLWRLAANGTDTMSGLPADRGWKTDVYHADAGRSYEPVGGFVYGAADFDAGFFGISPREALAMDPQQRLLLEVSWEALERAGIDPSSLHGSQTGVFVGAFGTDYGMDLPDGGGGHLLTGRATSVISGRIAYTLGLEGPAVTVDTVCSSSLVALHLACQSLRNADCAMALVGGVTIMSTPVVITEFSRQGGLASDGRCKSFAAAADGTGWGEGAGMLVVERLSQARRLGHPVLAVVTGSAINSDGASNGLSAPNGLSQERVIYAALDSARLSPADVDAVEAHGTGTRLGDPIEAQALIATYGQDRPAGQPLWLGSLKSNIGHTQAAAGVAGVIKVVQALQHQVLPPTLHVDEPSPHVDWTAGQVRLLTEPVPWPSGGDRPRRAGVSAFGISGTNAHAIVEEPPAPAEDAEPDAPAPAPQVLLSGQIPWLVSGRTAVGLRAQAGRLAAYLAAHPQLAAADVGYSLAATRTSFEHRAVITGRDNAELTAALSALAVGRPDPKALTVGIAPRPARTAFVFAGQGSQRAGMGAELHAASPVFAAAFDQACALLEAELGVPVAEVVLGGAADGRADQTIFAQAGLFAVQAGLVAMLAAGGITPDAVAGHSVGEVGAAYAAGVLSLEDACALVAARARLMQALPDGGAMTAVAASEAAVTAALAEVTGVSVAAVNGPAAVVISGDAAAVEQVAARFAARGVRVRSLRVSHAFHSHRMDPLLAELGQVATRLEYASPQVPWVGALSGEPIDTCGPEYWTRQAREPVRFADAVARLATAEEISVFIEIGPDGTLSALGPAALPDDDGSRSFIPVLRRDQPAPATVLAALALAHVAGVTVGWPAVLGRGQRIALPTYAFQRQRYWPDPPSQPTPEQDTERWRYQVTWAPVPDPEPAALSGTWLVVTPDGSSDAAVTQSCVAAMTARGAEVVVMTAGADRATLAGQLAAAPPVAGLLSLLALTEDLAATLTLIQALGDAGGLSAPLWVATQGAVAAAPHDTLTSPAQAQVWGLGRVAGLEHPDRWGGLIDVPAALDAQAADRLCAVLAAREEDQVAIRPAGILARRLTRAPLPRTSAERWTPRGTVLITGGTGAIGAHVARWVTSRGARHVVLTSRSGPAAPGVPALSAQLAAAGAQVTVLTCDLAERFTLPPLLTRLRTVGPPLSTVLHTAGVGEFTALADTTPAALATVLAGKVAGAKHLDELTAEADLDAFVLFSSISSTWGAGGQPGYAAANAFLDGLAENRRSRGQTALAVAWGPWRGDGMTTGEFADQIQRRGLRLMDPELAVAALGQALDHRETLLTVADVDWARFAPAFTLRRPSPLIAGLPEASQALAGADAATEAADTTLAHQLAGVAPAEQRRAVLDLVLAEAAAVLGHQAPEGVEAAQSFRQLGFDSLTAVELRTRLAAATGLRLPATLVFDYPTPVALTGHLLVELLGGQDAAVVPATGVPAVASGDPVAVVALGCRFPGGASSPEELWRLLAAGGDAISEFPADRGWDSDGLFDPDLERPGTSYVREGGFVPDAGDFDPGFFGISPREALAMDPQQRLLLEVCWEALERAGIDPASLRGSRTGVFAGTNGQDYAGLVGTGHGLEGHLITGSAASVLSGRVAYAFGLEGPAVSVDTACSSSLVALHLACGALRAGECDLALAGGVTVMATPAVFTEFSRQRALAADGRCKAYGAGADGTGWGEGAGMVVLERLSDARRNGHRVLAVVAGSAVNQDGASNGLTAPNGPSQQRVIRAALASAGLSAADVDAVEGHGTGTVLGDPIEAQALLATYGQDRPADRPLWLGSVKSNIGHTQAAAGVAGMIKMVLALQHGLLPPTLHADEPSPHVDWSAGAVRLATEPVPWLAAERPRRAGISAFGMSGTNAHLILQEPPAQEPPPTQEAPPGGPGGYGGSGRPSVLWGGLGGIAPPGLALLVSARTAEGLAAQAERLRQYAELAEADAADVAWSLATTRTVFEHRAVITGADRDELVAGLAALASGEPTAGVVSGVAGVAGAAGQTVFVFPGQGGQWAGMGRELAASSPVFAARLAECGQALGPYVPWSLDDVLARAAGAPGLDRAEVVQPVLWAVMVSLAATWQAAGVTPDAVLGHSQGEIAAATVAGILTLDDAAQVVALRSQALAALAGRGAMLSVAEPQAQVRARLAGYGDRLAVAAVNGPAATVVSGEPDALADLAAACATDGVRTKPVPVDYASHCAQVESIREDVLAALAGIEPMSAQVPMMSAMTGEMLAGPDAGAGYWYDSLRATVEFDRAVRALAGSGHGVFIEVSPHPVLTSPITQTLDDLATGPEPVVAGTLRRDDGGPGRFLAALGEVHVRGVAVDWAAVLGGGRQVDLPTYAFQRQRYWPRSIQAADVMAAGLGAMGHPLLSAAVELASGDGFLFTGRLSLRSEPWLADHAVAGTALLPGTAFLELALQAGDRAGCGRVAELTLEAPLAFGPDAVQVQVTVSGPDESGGRIVQVHSRPEDAGAQQPWTRNASGLLDPRAPDQPVSGELAVWPPSGAVPLATEGFYPALAATGYEYGPAFQGLRAVWHRGEDIFAEIVLPEAAGDGDAFGLHPALLDAAWHAAGLGRDADEAQPGTEPDDGVRQPFAWTGVTLHAAGASALRVRLRPAGGGMSLIAADPAGAPVMTVDSLVLRPMAAPPQASRGPQDALYSVTWTPLSPAVEAATGRWAVIGADGLGLVTDLSAAGVAVSAYPDLAALAGAVEAGEPAPDTALVLAGTATGPGGPETAETVRSVVARLLTLAQQWLAEERLAPTRLAVVTRGAVAAAPGETVPDLAGAAAWGLVRSVQSENPGRLILADLDPAAAADTADSAQTLINAQTLATALTCGEPELAIRAGVAYVRRLTRPADAPLDQATPRPSGAVLVTGGTGTLGALVASHLAATGQAAAFVLASRSGPAAPGVARLAADLAGHGSQVQITACDAADRTALTALLAQDRLAPLTMVIHAAGVLDDAVTESLTPARLEAVMRPKTDAAWHLHELTRHLDLDAFVLFSSAAATLGSAGQGSYAAANAFLDGLACHRRAAGLPAVSLAWGLWADASAMTGHLGQDERARLNRGGMAELSSGDALALLDLAMTRDEALLVPARLELAGLKAQVARAGIAEVPAVLRELAGPPGPPGRPAQSRRANPAGPRADASQALRRRLAGLPRHDQDRMLVDLVRTHAAVVLGHPAAGSVGASRAFRDLGFDSLTALELRNRLTAATGLRLPATLVFDYPSPVMLAGHLLGELNGTHELPAGPAPRAVAGPADEPVAIVAMGCRFPGGIRTPEDLWELMAGAGDAISEWPLNRGWDAEALFHPDPGHAGTSYVRDGGFVYDAGDFDPRFFGISPREALAMDPQQRLLLEVSWEALERAGIDPASLHGSPTGVFAGAAFSGYGAELTDDNDGDNGSAGFLLTGTATSVLSGRVSYTLGLEGPAVTVDTACSSALVALHLACQALRLGECSLALAGGVAVMATPVVFTEFSRQRGLAPDGRCKSFAAAADGTGWGEGAGMVVLERLSDARRNGHRVLAVVAGSAVNQDGASNGLTAPNGPAQQRVIRAALASAGLSAADVDAVEGHGTGTVLGDPIEAQALIAAYGQDRPEDRPLWLGSVKSNIGHTQAAAGVAGVIKMVLALQHGLLPATSGVDEPSPHVDWSAGSVRLATEPVAWPPGERPRRAGVSSFGISGTNAHAVLAEAPADDAPDSAIVAPEPVLATGIIPWLVSARTAAGLTAQAARLAAHLRPHPDLDPSDASDPLDPLDPADVGWSLATTRSAFEHRAVVTGTSSAELTAALAALAGGHRTPALTVGAAAHGAQVGFVFAGQGSQRAGMGAELFAASPVFAAAFGRVCELLEAELGVPVAEVVLGGAPDERADQTMYAQAGLFAVQVGLVALLAACGITPAAVAGHSVGEVAAAYAAGVLSLEDACALVAARARLMQALPGGGAMTAIAAGEAEVTAALAGVAGVSVAAVNGPSAVVISGDEAAVEQVAAGFADRGVRVRRLRVSHAFHSARMDPILDELGRIAAALPHAAPWIPWACGLSGELTNQPDPAYWVAQARQPVRFAGAVTTLAGQGISVFIEIGPDGTLSALGPAALPDPDGAVFVPLLRRDRAAPATVVAALAQAHVRGVAVDWPAAVLGGRRRQVDLPTYAFQRQRYWPDPPPRRRELDRSAAGSWRYRVSWMPVPDPEPAVLDGRWLLVVTAGCADGLAAGCARALEAGGAEVVVVEVPPGGDRAMLANQFAGITGSNGVTGILSLVGLKEEGGPACPAGLAETLVLVQALGDAGVEAPLWVLTCGAVSAAGEVLASPVQAMLWGLGRVVALEHPDRWGGLVDVPAVLDERAGARLCGVLAGCGEDQVAIRPAGVRARRLVRAPQPPATETRWAPRGTVLITGGTGAIGGHLARWAAGRGAAHLVLASRSGPAAPGVALLSAQLAATGAQVTVLTCDLAERSALSALLTRIRTAGPPLSTVMHTAGTQQATAVADTTVAELAAVMAAKTAGAAHLDELTAGLDLAAFVLFSSAAATWGGSLQPGYAAANAYLDGLAESRHARGLAATSVAWGLWGTAGMSLGPAAAQLRRHGLRLLDPGLAVEALGQVLDHDETLLTLADVDWDRFAPAFTLRRPSALFADLPEVKQALAAAAAAGQAARGPDAPGAGTALGQQLASLSAAEQDQVILDHVRTEAAVVLGHSSPTAIETGWAFSELGFDSLTALELRDRLAAVTGLRLPATLVFDYPTPAALADHLVAELVGRSDAAVVSFSATVSGEPVAVVALSCRFPGGASSPEALWQLLAAGGDAISEFPADRGWDLHELYDPDPGHAGTSYVRTGGFVHDAGDFDPGFFGISPREALAMDPQQRLLLEVCWEAVERAGIDPASLRGSPVGVFTGTNGQDYAGLAAAAGPELEGHLITGSAASVISGRVAYTLGLEGPAVSVDTACSSSLVALHLAGQALRSGECDLALAGGVTVMATPAAFTEFSRQRGLAPDGRCKPFGAAADGTAWAEGAGIVLLERLSDARRNGHPVLAVVRGSAVNQDGASNGLTAPNGPSQQRVIRAALASAGLSAADVDAVEAHGTGTVLGDPIEAQALLATYGQDRDAQRPLWLGSVKSNIGHTQAAAGVAGVIKMVLALQHGLLPPTLHAQEPSPHVDWSAGTVQLATEPVPWTAGERPRRAGISAFGMSGTNAHLILEQPPAEREETAPTRKTPLPGSTPLLGPAPLAGPTPFLISGRTGPALAAQARRLAAVQPELGPLADVAWSLATSRSTLAHRAVVIGGNATELAAGLAAVAAGEPAAGVVSAVAGTAGKVVFVFPGQGGQWAGMGRELAASSPVFAARLAECGRALAPHVDWDLEQVLAGAGQVPDLDRADVVQPVLWAVMVSLAAMWQAAGVTPDAVAGHSQGEIAAAAVAGILSLEDAALVVARRSRALMALASRGAMLSVDAAAAQVRDQILPWADQLAVAAVNGPSATVVSGEPEAVAELAAACATAGIRTKQVPVDYASHGVQVEQLREQILTALAAVTPGPGQVPMLSAMTGQWLDGPQAGAVYWYDSLRAPVDFDRAVRVLADAGHQVYIEISPHPILTTPITQTLEDAQRLAGAGPAPEPVITGTLRRGDGGPRRFLVSLAAVHVRGVAVDWPAVLGGGRRVDLPTYAFQRQRYWPRPASRPVAAENGALGALGPGAAADARFWAVVEGGDLESLSHTLTATDQARLAPLLPMLASWRRRELDRSITESWRYQVSWAPIPDPAPAVLAGQWLLLVNAGCAGELAASCVRALEAGGAEVVVVEVPPDGDRAMLADRLTRITEGPGICGVLSLVGLEEAGGPGRPAGLAGTLAVVQALGDAGVAAPLWMLTCGAVAAAAGEALTSPVQAMVWGMGRVAALEHPDRWGGLVDVPAVLDDRSAARLCGVLGGCGEDQVAIRPAGIKARRLIRAPRPERLEPSWAPRGSVLITGGTGAIGGHAARWIAGQGARHVVLASRSGPSAPSTPALAAQLAGSGTQATVLACDLAERSSVSALITRIDASGPPLSTVMHTAGVLDDGVLDRLTAPRLAGVLGAKAAAAAHLDELTAGHDLDAFVLFSGAAGTLGSGGQGNYAAANAFLDALAQRRSAQGRAALSVAWGPWGGDGLAHEDAIRNRLRRDGMRSMDPDQAIKALSQALDAGDSWLTVMDVDWERFASVTGAARLPMFRDLPEVRALDRDSGPEADQDEARLAHLLAGVPQAEQGRVILKLIQAEAAAVLGHSSPAAVEAALTFRDLGFDSLTAVELRNRLGVAAGLQLPATLVFDYPNPVLLGEYLQARTLARETDYLPVMDELDKLESILSSIGGDGDGKSRITARLEAIMQGFNAVPADDPVIGHQLEAATDDEMFDLVERELRAFESD